MDSSFKLIVCSISQINQSLLYNFRAIHDKKENFIKIFRISPVNKTIFSLFIHPFNYSSLEWLWINAKKIELLPKISKKGRETKRFLFLAYVIFLSVIFA